MFAVVVELLAGRYAAMAYNDRDRVEWPPHPARLFSALVAVWGEDDPHGSRGEAERAALEWLEAQSAPEILADRIEEAGVRTVVPVFVPVNDQYEVSEVSRDKLDEAETSAQLLQGKARTSADKALDKLRKKLLDDTQKAIAVPVRLGKERNLGTRVLPEGRGRQPRTFPSAHPRTPKFAFVWAEAKATAATIDGIASLLSRLVRLGHSSSPVRASIASAAEVTAMRDPQRTFRPDEKDGEHVIRWVDPGQLARLCEAYDRHKETEPRVLPARFVRYTHRRTFERPDRPRTLFDDEFVVLERVSGPRLPITSVAGLARQFRRALMARADQPVDPMISGHRVDGSPSDVPHLAVVPLPFVGHRQADGGILGVAVILPRDAEPLARRSVAQALVNLEASVDEDRLVRIDLSGSPLFLKRVPWQPPQDTLRAARWTGPARRWATVTPIALDRNPGDLHAESSERRSAAFEEATKLVVEALQHIGLPEPLELDVVRSCVLPGTAKPRTYPRFPADPSRVQRVFVHARIGFAEPVSGPLLVGAGRYQGLGLCSPVREGDR